MGHDAFERGAAQRHLQRLPGREFDEDAAPRLRPDQPLTLQLADRVLDRRRADAEHLGEVALVQPFSVAEAPGDNGPAQPLVHMLAQGAQQIGCDGFYGRLQHHGSGAAGSASSDKPDGNPRADTSNSTNLLRRQSEISDFKPHLLCYPSGKRPP